MNYGLYLSATGMLTNLYRQDIYAHNLANVETVGFKVDMPTLQQRDPEAVEENHGFDVSGQLLERLGGGVLAGPQRISFAPGAFQQTGNPYDLALEDPQTFFAIAGRPEQGEPPVFLTRDGRFSRNDEGYLVSVGTGRKVLNERDQPIQVPGRGAFAVAPDGRVLVDGETVARLGVSGVQNLDSLEKHGENLFTWRTPGDLRTPASHVAVRQGAVEASGADPVQTLMKLVEATKAATGNANLIRYHDQLMQQAINTLGRVA